MEKPDYLNTRKDETKNIGELASELMMQIRKNASEQKYIPPADVWESDAAYHIAVYLPGIEKDKVELDIKDGFLVISGERTMAQEMQEQKIRKLESQYGYFQRRIKLNQKTDIQSIIAQMSAGVLNIQIPKMQQREYTTTIKVA